MQTRELKALLKTAYGLGRSGSEKAFVRSHEQRSMRLWDVIKTEFRFMGLKSGVSGMILLAALAAIALTETKNEMWCVSSMLPLFSMLPAALIGSSERYGMNELECSCRFSLSFIRMVRILILGAISLILLSLCTVLIRTSPEVKLPVILFCISFPYFTNVFGCLVITRRIHRSDNILACAGMTCLSCLLPSLARLEAVRRLGLPGNAPACAVTALMLALTVCEAILYIREGDKEQWNLC